MEGRKHLVLRGVDSITRRNLPAFSQPALQWGHIGLSEPESGKRLNPVNDLRIAIRMRSTVPIGRFRQRELQRLAQFWIVRRAAKFPSEVWNLV